jgi:hypothetical protein
MAMNAAEKSIAKAGFNDGDALGGDIMHQGRHSDSNAWHF